MVGAGPSKKPAAAPILSRARSTFHSNRGSRQTLHQAEKKEVRSAPAQCWGEAVRPFQTGTDVAVLELEGGGEGDEGGQGRNALRSQRR